MDETLSSSGNNIHGKNNLILEKKNLANRNTRKNPGKHNNVSPKTFSVQRHPRNPSGKEGKDDRRGLKRVYPPPSTSCRTRDGNKMWNCKLCVGKIGPWTVVAVDHASWRKRWNPPHPIIPTHREGWSLRIRKEGRPVGEKREGFVVDLNARSSDRATFEGEGVAHSLEGAGNLLRYVERSLPSEYEERFLLWFEEGKGWMAVPLLTVEGRWGLVGRFAVEEEAGRGRGWWTRCQEYKARDERDGGHICDS